jgi:putative DNA methylase
MVYSHRRLPYLYDEGQPVFLTWCLHGSLPCHRVFPADALTSGQAFAAMDRLLDEARRGVRYLRQPGIADMVVEGIRHNDAVLGHYFLHAYAVMPNHVHLLVTPLITLPKLTKSLKGITAKRANAMLKLTVKTFWQDESYDHLVRNGREFDRIRNYIEQNPVRAGLVSEPSDYPWSSAGADRGSPADEGVRPTIGLG